MLLQDLFRLICFSQMAIRRTSKEVNAAAAFEFSSQTDALIVRRGGFFSKPEATGFMCLILQGNLLQNVQLSINRQNTLHYEVMEGLRPGEKVIISSYDSFGDKDKVVFK